MAANYANVIIKIMVYELWHNCSSYEHNIEQKGLRSFKHCSNAFICNTVRNNHMHII